jgi:hypothetical protein
MLTPTAGGAPFPVGLMQRLPDGRWFWWEAGGETEFAGHVIGADRVKVWHGGLAVEFRQGEEWLGYLTTIGESMDDPAGVDRVTAVIRDWKSEYDRNATLQSFITRQSLQVRESA